MAKYLKENNEEIFKDHLFSMYVTLGVSKTFSGSFDESNKTLKELFKFEPDNYSTMYDLGFAYYYISCNYYYLGDYIKSLEELNKGISCMNQTDDIGGQLFLEQRKAFVQYTTKNNEDALTTIEKCLKLYKKIDDKEGEALAMLSKFDYLSRTDRNKAYDYIDFLLVHS